MCGCCHLGHCDLFGLELVSWVCRLTPLHRIPPPPPCGQIEVWDYHRTGFDKLIGSTTIDLEDRWFSSAWHATGAADDPLSQPMKPMERRVLFHPKCSGPQGVVELWLDMLTPAQARM